MFVSVPPSHEPLMLVTTTVPETQGYQLSLQVYSWSWRWSLFTTVSLSVLVSGSHLEPTTRFLFSVWQLRVSCWGAPSLTRGWVCNLLVHLFLGLARAVTLGSKSHRTRTIFYCLIWDSPNLEGQVPVFISPRNRVAQLNHRALQKNEYTNLPTRHKLIFCL
jgi:hypothetical protein